MILFFNIIDTEITKSKQDSLINWWEYIIQQWFGHYFGKKEATNPINRAFFCLMQVMSLV